MGFYKLMCKTYTLHITAAAGRRRASPSAEDTVRPQAQAGTRAKSLHDLLVELRPRGSLRPRTLTALQAAQGGVPGCRRAIRSEPAPSPRGIGAQGPGIHSPLLPPPTLTPTPRGPQ